MSREQVQEDTPMESIEKVTWEPRVTIFDALPSEAGLGSHLSPAERHAVVERARMRQRRRIRRRARRRLGGTR